MSKRPAPRRTNEGPNPKAPCPCGSGRRYKACHGSDYAPITERPFLGAPSECDWIALRELVPAATAKLKVAGDVEVTLATVLPMAAPALKREDGTVLVAAQTTIPGLDPGRDIALAITRAIAAEPGTVLDYQASAYDGPTLGDVLGSDPLEIAVHDDFGFWVEDPSDPAVQESLQRANDTVFPTRRLTSVDAAYWCVPGEKAHLRWVMPHGEDELLDALARLSARGELGLGDETRFAGQFRAYGLLVPVWDLPADAHASEWEAPAAAMKARIDEALAIDVSLDEHERRARAGLIGRQVTLR